MFPRVVASVSSRIHKSSATGMRWYDQLASEVRRLMSAHQLSTVLTKPAIFIKFVLSILLHSFWFVLTLFAVVCAMDDSGSTSRTAPSHGAIISFALLPCSFLVIRAEIPPLLEQHPLCHQLARVDHRATTVSISATPCKIYAEYACTCADLKSSAAARTVALTVCGRRAWHQRRVRSIPQHAKDHFTLQFSAAVCASSTIRAVDDGPYGANHIGAQFGRGNSSSIRNAHRRGRVAPGDRHGHEEIEYRGKLAANR